MKTIVLPRAGITLLPPWWGFILWAGKRCENRAPSVAGRIRGWRGVFAFGASKSCDKDEARAVTESVLDEPWFKCSKSITLGEIFKLGGHIVGAAELIDVRPNGPDPTDPWAVPGECGLILGRVWEVEPVPCSGGRGMFALGACAACGHIGAIENKGAPLICRKCKATTPRDALGRPELRVVAEFGADGRPA